MRSLLAAMLACWLIFSSCNSNAETYYDLDKARSGTYVYDATQGTIRFSGGFLGYQTGTDVSLAGFQISSTVRAEPWR